MIGLLARFAPGAVLLIGLISGALPAGGLAWFGRGLVFDWFERPAIERAATSKAGDACTIRVQAAADQAEAIERARQKAAGAEALRIYQRALAQSELEAQLAARQHEQEISDYEQQLSAEGRTCDLTQPDIDFVFSSGTAGANGGG